VRRCCPAAGGSNRGAVGPFRISSTTSARSTPGPSDNHDVRPHPHIGLATVTYLFEGAMLHRDSLGRRSASSPARSTG
jgi:redox-sensitive bicupin YhaK (pirin superfamily)